MGRIVNRRVTRKGGSKIFPGTKEGHKKSLKYANTMRGNLRGRAKVRQRVSKSGKYVVEYSTDKW